MTDPYRVLGINQNATEDEVKKAYKKMSMKHHPDRGGNHDDFVQVQQAYNEIKNPPSNDWNTTKQEYAHTGGFEDLFRQHFGTQFQNRQQRNADVRIVYHITLEELITNDTKNVEIRYTGGSRTVSIQIPPGIEDGSEVQYHGFGADNIDRLAPGNLIVQYQFKRHPEFTVDRYNLIKRLNISIRDAMIGTEKIITTLDGRSIKLKIQPGTQSKSRLRIPESGLPRNRLPNGDLYVEINVNIPPLTQPDLDKPLKDLI
jgi:DnaJ-class molecular chaperone